MKARDFKNRIYNELASIAKALASPHRLEIIELLAQGPCPVEYIAENTGISIASASHHLQILKKARLAKYERKGKYNYYSLSNSRVFEVWKTLRELGFSQNAEIEKLIRDFRDNRQSLESITSEELQKRLVKNNVLVLDVRPKEEYEEGHIANAISIPSDQLADRLNELPKNREIIAYCRGPLCAMADEAVDMLKKYGFRSKRLNEGYPEWLLQNLPVEQNA